MFYYKRYLIFCTKNLKSHAFKYKIIFACFKLFSYSIYLFLAESFLSNILIDTKAVHFSRLKVFTWIFLQIKYINDLLLVGLKNRA